MKKEYTIYASEQFKLLKKFVETDADDELLSVDSDVEDDGLPTDVRSSLASGEAETADDDEITSTYLSCEFNSGVDSCVDSGVDSDVDSGVEDDKLTDVSTSLDSGANNSFRSFHSDNDDLNTNVDDDNFNDNFNNNATWFDRTVPLHTVVNPFLKKLFNNICDHVKKTIYNLNKKKIDIFYGRSTLVNMTYTFDIDYLPQQSFCVLSNNINTPSTYVSRFSNVDKQRTAGGKRIY